MSRNQHTQYLSNPSFYGTAAEAAAQEVEDLIVRKSHAICDDSIDWDALIDQARAKLAQTLKA